jgi:hypothetical protein
MDSNSKQSESPSANPSLLNPTLSKLNFLMSKTPKFQNRPSPPFKPGGRGSKQLSKAIEQSKETSELEDDATKWVLCYGRSPCFAKVISSASEENLESILIQPMRQSPHDPRLLILWEGHLWLAKSDKLYPVKVRRYAYCGICSVSFS